MELTTLSILHQDPHPRLDRMLGRQTLTFAFATGSGGDPFERLLSKQRVPPTLFASDCFAPDLFLDSFVERCLLTKLPGTERRFHLRSLRQSVAAPPVDLTDIRLRQAVFQELRLPKPYDACKDTWRLIDGLRVLLESSEMGKRFDPIARRVEILRQLDQLMRHLIIAFGGTQSALNRIARFAEQAIASPEYRHLEQLLEYDDHLATLDVELRIDRDGQIRSLAIVDQQENNKHPLYRSPLVRLWQRIAALLRGYAVREREVIGRLIEAVFDSIWPLFLNLLELSLDLEFYLALDGFRRLCEKQRLDCCMPSVTVTGSNAPLRLEQVYNPFLLLEERRPVPCDLELSGSGLVLLTGPNSGGKTRLLQSIGFVQLLAQSGAWVPARAATVPLRTGLFVSLVHESSSDQREGRLGTELMRIRRLFERLEYDQLVLLDELCSGTNPNEGEEIVELVISLLTELRPQAVITTHFLEFAKRLALHPPVAKLSFLQVALDAHQVPLFQFVPGVATTSLAHLTAERLGVTREALQTVIRSKRDPEASPVRSAVRTSGILLPSENGSLVRASAEDELAKAGE
ncbi:MAG TPA: DNA mismatch repair protein [Polyangiaceae bacterium]